MIDDSTLLQRFADDRSDSVFRQLTERHLGLVYHTALRRTGGDVHLAEEATQAVFCDLARKAPQLVAHPNLVGWLHTSARYATSTLTRAMIRRQTHEQPLENLCEPPADNALPAELGDVIDDALEALPADDREAVLLRFLENQPFATIGARLHISEDAARMRTSRAVEKLRGILGARGITSTAAALSGALAAQCAPVPAALTGQLVTSHSLNTLGVATTTTAGTGALAWLTSAPLAWCVAAAATTVAVTLMVLTPEPNPVTTPDTSETAATATPNANDKIEPPSATATPTIPEPDPVITKEVVDARYERGKQFAQSGHYHEALEDFRWCFEIGMPRVTGFAGVRLSYLLNDIRKLANDYPEAREYLELRRLDALAAFDDPISGPTAAGELSALNHQLGRDEESLELFLTLPLDDPRRDYLGNLNVVELLRDRQRYADAATVVTKADLMIRFEAQSRLAGRLEKMPASSLAIIQDNFVSLVARNAEILAGAGQLDDARWAIETLYTFDHSQKTQALMQHHLARAGHPDLLANIPLPEPSR